MSDFSDYAEDLILDWLLQTAAAGSAPTNLFLSLHTSAPNDAGVGGELTTGDIAGYTRQSITFANSSSGQAASSNSQTFTAGGGEGPFTITHLSIWDNATQGSGNCIFAGAMTVSRTIAVAGSMVFNTGDVVCGAD